MTKYEELVHEIEGLQDRLSRLSEATLRINESLDFDNVLHEVLENARLLTEARYGVITVFDEAGQVEDFLSSGLTSEESQRLWELPEGQTFFHLPKWDSGAVASTGLPQPYQCTGPS